MEPPEALIGRLPDCLHWSSDGEIRVVGHRIGLYHLIFFYNEGFSAEMLLCQFPTLELVAIHKVIAFYLENRRLRLTLMLPSTRPKSIDFAPPGGTAPACGASGTIR